MVANGPAGNRQGKRQASNGRRGRCSRPARRGTGGDFPTAADRAVTRLLPLLPGRGDASSARAPGGLTETGAGAWRRWPTQGCCRSARLGLGPGAWHARGGRGCKRACEKRGTGPSRTPGPRPGGVAVPERPISPGTLSGSGGRIEGGVGMPRARASSCARPTPASSAARPETTPSGAGESGGTGCRRAPWSCLLPRRGALRLAGLLPNAAGGVGRGKRSRVTFSAARLWAARRGRESVRYGVKRWPKGYARHCGEAKTRCGGVCPGPSRAKEPG
jgi:hypothetical protein